MATKKDVLIAAMAICEAHGASNELTGELNTLLAPKTGGAKVNVDDVFDGENLLCSVSGVWLPATLDYFYEDKSGKSEFNGLRRLSRQAESIRKTHTKVIKTSEAAIMNDVLDGVITPDEGKEKIEELKAVSPDFSMVSADLDSEEA